MAAVRFAVLAVLALALSGSALARSDAAPAPPAGLKAFLLRADEAATHDFPRTPSFAWRPVQGALRYEFELAKSPGFGEGTVLWSSDALKIPAVSVPVALPWMTGRPYAAYARVRAVTAAGVSGWSPAYGFNLRWGSTPAELSSYPGMSRWTMVDGATGYHVWFPDLRKVVATKTNAVDHREFYSFHQQQAFSGTVRWRVRAVRALYGERPNGLPAVSYGPWSRTFTAANPQLATGPLALTATAAGATLATPAAPRLHELTPGFAFAGNQATSGVAAELYRVYVYSDAECVNVVYRGAIVGSPAYVPRTTGPLALPPDAGALARARSRFLRDGAQGSTYTADGLRIQTTESDKAKAQPGGAEKPRGDERSDDPAATPPAEDPNLPATPAATGAPVDLWDSGWPNGRYYWTVVPVEIVQEAPDTTILAGAVPAGATSLTVANAAYEAAAGSAVVVGTGSNRETAEIATRDGATLALTAPLRYSHSLGETVEALAGALSYYDLEAGQDACAAGRVAEFGKESEPAVARTSTPFVSGLSPAGRLTAARSASGSVYGNPLVAWRPALGADQYQVQWSSRRYPWREAGSSLTFATSTLLPLEPGTWWYRVRGLNFSLPGTARAMTWSEPVRVHVARPAFAVVSRRK